MVDQSINHGFAAVDQVHDTLRQTGLLEQFKGTSHRQRNAFGGFQNESVSAGDRVRQKPKRNHAGKIERSDGGNDSERLPDHGFVDAARDIFKVVPLHHHGNAAGDFDVFNSAAKLGFGFSKGFAVFLRDDSRQLVNVILEKHFQLEEGLNAVLRGSASPGGISRGSGFNRFADFGGIRKRNAGEDFASGWIGYILPLGSTGVVP